MNVNPESEQFGQIVAWDSLTEEQQKSDDWLKLPSHDENGEAVMCRRKNLLEKMFPRDEAKEMRQAREAFAKAKGQFDALGRPR